MAPPGKEEGTPLAALTAPPSKTAGSAVRRIAPGEEAGFANWANAGEVVRKVRNSMKAGRHCLKVESRLRCSSISPPVAGRWVDLAWRFSTPQCASLIGYSQGLNRLHYTSKGVIRNWVRMVTAGEPGKADPDCKNY